MEETPKSCVFLLTRRFDFLSSRSLELAAAAFEERLNRALALVDEKQQQPQTPGHARKDSRDPELWNKTVAMLEDLEIRQRTLEQTKVLFGNILMILILDRRQWHWSWNTRER